MTHSGCVIFPTNIPPKTVTDSEARKRFGMRPDAISDHLKEELDLLAAFQTAPVQLNRSWGECEVF